MSQVYSTEPSTTGQVILDTTHGPIDIHLWCKECPHTCRLFLQLALDGYYDSLPFHRIMQDFMIQTGQRPKINTSSHETDLPKERDAYFQYLEVQGGIKQDPVETMARIRFNHRGQVAMARSCDPAIAFKKDETHLRGQFFMTLDEATHLNDKHIIFGSIVGPTVFNALRIGRIEAAEDGSPMDMESCPLVKKVIIKDHPFTDLVMSKDIPWKISVNNASLDDKKKKKKKRKGKRDLNVLSFGNEEEEMDQIIHKEEAVGMKSSHDVIGIENGSSLSKNVDIQVAKLVYGDENKKLEKEKKKKSVKKDLNDEKLVLSSEKMQSSINHKDEDVKNYSNTDEKFQKLAPETSSNSSMLPSTLHSTNVTTETKVKTSLSKKTESKPKISAVEARRAKYLKKRKSPGDDPMASKKGKRDENTLSKLLAFRSKVMKIKGNPKNSGKTVSRKDIYTLHVMVICNDLTFLKILHKRQNLLVIMDKF